MVSIHKENYEKISQLEFWKYAYQKERIAIKDLKDRIQTLENKVFDQENIIYEKDKEIQRINCICNYRQSPVIYFVFFLIGIVFGAICKGFFL